MTLSSASSAVIYDVFPGQRTARGHAGGKRVAVFGDAEGDLQARAAKVGVPLSVFVESFDQTSVHLRVFTPEREKGESDSASVAALTFLQAELGDLTQVQTGSASTAAQLCGGEWLLSQGAVDVRPAAPFQQRLPGLPEAKTVHVASTERPNLMIELPDLATLDGFMPDAEAIRTLGRETETTGLVLYTTAPLPAGQGRADVCFRAFGPLKGFLEDAASSNMFACLTGTLAGRGLLPAGETTIRGAQRQPGQLSKLTAQFGGSADPVWVGGQAIRLA